MVLVIKGDFEEITNSTPISLAFGNNHTYPNDIDTKGASEITVQVSNTTALNVDVFVYGDLGLGYSTIPVGEMNLGSDSTDILFVNTGIYKMKLKIVNNDTSGTTTINYKVVVKR